MKIEYVVVPKIHEGITNEHGVVARRRQGELELKVSSLPEQAFPAGLRADRADRDPQSAGWVSENELRALVERESGILSWGFWHAGNVDELRRCFVLGHKTLAAHEKTFAEKLAKPPAAPVEIMAVRRAWAESIAVTIAEVETSRLARLPGQTVAIEVTGVGETAVAARVQMKPVRPSDEPSEDRNGPAVGKALDVLSSAIAALRAVGDDALAAQVTTVHQGLYSAGFFRIALSDTASRLAQAQRAIERMPEPEPSLRVILGLRAKDEAAKP